MLELLMIAAIAAGVVLLVRSLAAVFDWVLLGREPALLRPLLAPLHEWRDARRPAPPPLPAVLHELELARLAAELRRVRDSNQPGLATRCAPAPPPTTTCCCAAPRTSASPCPLRR